MRREAVEMLEDTAEGRRLLKGELRGDFFYVHAVAQQASRLLHSDVQHPLVRCFAEAESNKIDDCAARYSAVKRESRHIVRCLHGTLFHPLRLKTSQDGIGNTTTYTNYLD